MNHNHYTRIKKKSLDINDNRPRYQISECENFDEQLKNILEEANLGDYVDYLTNNQLGVKLYEIVINKKNQRTIKEIGDIYGPYDSPEHPDHPDYNRNF
jgi:hypothetical protein